MDEADRVDKRNQVWIVDALIFKIKRLETLVDAVKDIKRDGVVGRGKEIAGSQTVEILHERWIALLDALNEVS